MSDAGLEAGADDYIPNRLNRATVLRIKRILQRNGSANQNQKSHLDHSFNPNTGMLSKSENEFIYYS